MSIISFSLYISILKNTKIKTTNQEKESRERVVGAERERKIWRGWGTDRQIHMRTKQKERMSE